MKCSPAPLSARALRCAALCVLALACVAASPTQEEAPRSPGPDAPFELARLMADPEWIARSPQDPWWSPDAGAILFWRPLQGRRGERELVRIDLATGVEEVLDDARRAAAGSGGGEWDHARRRFLSARSGDLFLHDLELGTERQLTRTRARESDPLWLADGERVAFQRDGTWFARRLSDGFEEELATLLAADDPEAEREEKDRERSFLERQQERLFDVVRERRARREAARDTERRLEAADPSRAPLPWYLGKDRRLLEQRLAPDGAALAVRLGRGREEAGKRDALVEWISDSGLSEARDARANVGREPRNPETLIVLDLTDRARIEVDLSTLPGLAGPAPTTTAEGDPSPPDREPRGAPELAFTRLVWSPDGARLAVAARSLDNHQRWIFVLAQRGRELVALHHLVDEAWINARFSELGWLPDGSGLWFLSEESGWSQLHLWEVEGGPPRALTTGEGEVDRVEVHPSGRWIYYRSNLGDPGVQEVWRVAPRGGEPERVSDHGGQLTYSLAPDGERLLLLASRALEPPDLFVRGFEPGSSARRLTRSVSAEFEALPWVLPQRVAVPTRHARPAHGRLFVPPPQFLPPAGQRPAVLFVHGAGYLQSAHAGWPRYLRETLFHTLLARRGVLVLDLDYRASAGYGRDWRTAIRLKVGEPELDDLEDGVAWLVREHGVDPARVGVYGGSYGGFLVLQALFTRPALFACGAALRPVTDWAHYNHGYTVNLLGVPEEQGEAYAQSSPIEHAAGLAVPLLICHGLIDDNVLAKDSVRLVQRLIELGKDGWELALYPAENHGFIEPSSWLDQYRRVLRLFERHLRL